MLVRLYCCRNLLPVACCLLPVACCLLPVACCLLAGFCCLLLVLYLNIDEKILVQHFLLLTKVKVL